MNIAIVGAGTAGTAVGVALARAGHVIVAVTGRGETAARAGRWLPGAALRAIPDAVQAAELVVIGVPDDALGSIVDVIGAAIAPGTWVVHLSGANGLGVLAPIVAAKGRALALHPLQTFADVGAAVEGLDGCAVAVTAEADAGWQLGERLAHDLGGRPFRLVDEARPLYHAAAVFGSNYLVTVSGAAHELFTAAGVPKALAAMRPLQDAALENVHRLGPAAALTGPAVRGDAGTIDRNLRSIAGAAPHLVAPYVAMCRASMELAGERLSSEGRASIEGVLAAWS